MPMSESLSASRYADPTPIRPPEDPDTPVAPLPRPLTSFVPREREQQAIITLLGQEDVRLVSLTGPGGAGKTRLAIRVAEALQENFSTIWFVPLASVADAALFLPSLARTLGLRETSREQLL